MIFMPILTTCRPCESLIPKLKSSLAYSTSTMATTFYDHLPILKRSQWSWMVLLRFSHCLKNKPIFVSTFVIYCALLYVNTASGASISFIQLTAWARSYNFIDAIEDMWNWVSIIQRNYLCKMLTMPDLAALRFFRACVGVMDPFYNQNLIKQNVFEPTIRVLLDTDGRNNLLNSACLEILEFIRKVKSRWHWQR